MKEIVLVFSLIFAATLPLRAESVASADLERTTKHLTQTRDAFLASIEGLSEAQLTFKPAPERWSVAEVAEHIVAAEQFLFGLVRDHVMKAPPRPEAVDVHETDNYILQTISDRTHKVKSPEPLMPTKRFGDIENVRREFEAAREQTLAFLQKAPDLRDHALDSPLGRKLDALQWLLFISAHCERHTKQIEEVKADSAFPKN